MYIIKVFQQLGKSDYFEGYFLGKNRIVGINHEPFPSCSKEVKFAKKYKNEKLAKKWENYYTIKYNYRFIFQVEKMKEVDKIG